MIGLDTNVILRYIAQDEADQARLATDLIETHWADFADDIALYQSRNARALPFFTFDRKLARHPDASSVADRNSQGPGQDRSS